MKTLSGNTITTLLAWISAIALLGGAASWYFHWPVQIAEAMSASNKVMDKQVILRVWSQGGSRYLVIKERNKQ